MGKVSLIHEVAIEVGVEPATADQALARFYQRAGAGDLEACAICHHQQHVGVTIAGAGAFELCAPLILTMRRGLFRNFDATWLKQVL
jgi:hypothetical protein